MTSPDGVAALDFGVGATATHRTREAGVARAVREAVLPGNLWRACALTLGVLVGYLSFSITHHAIHHWRADSAWLKQRKRWHALHLVGSRVDAVAH